MTPWLIDQLAAAHVEDLRRAAASRALSELPARRPPRRPAIRPWLGHVLIRAGSRLGGAEAGAALSPGRPRLHVLR